MKLELSNDFFLDDQLEVSFAELAELSGLSETELLEMVDNGVLVPNNPLDSQWSFGGSYVVTVRSACRLRNDFELDTNALSLIFLMLERIRELETKLCTAQAKLPGQPCVTQSQRKFQPLK